MKHAYKEIPNSSNMKCVRCCKVFAESLADIDYTECPEISPSQTLEKIALSELREHMRNNFRTRYFIGDIEIVAVTQNFWFYDKDGRAHKGYASSTVSAKKEK